MGHLSVDIGNSDVVLGLLRNGSWEIQRIPVISFLENQIVKLEVGEGVNLESIAMSSVVPEATSLVASWIGKHTGKNVYSIGPGSYERLSVQTSNPKQIGTDLMANATAAFDRFTGRTVVVDFGTALTFTSIEEDGHLKGVAILPGVKTAMRTLSSNASQLFEVPLEVPDSVFGKDTIHAIQSGILFGYSGVVDGILGRIKEEWGQDFSTIATGGLANTMESIHHHFDEIDTCLTLEGIHLIYQANC